MSRRKVCLPSTIFTPSSAGASYVHIGTGNIFKLIYTYFLFSGLWGKRGGKTCRNNFFSKTVFKLFCGVGGGVRSYNPSGYVLVPLSMASRQSQLKTASTVKRQLSVEDRTARSQIFLVFIFIYLSTECSLRQGQLRDTLKYKYS